MTQPKLPLTVISGYLGAGKTTLINQLLAEDHGQRLLVMVNDFGAINIDADLLASADEDTLTLTNGCVCCTMGADLFMALGDALDCRPRPDHLIIEASGIADPSRIANAAITEPELAYGGIITVVDGMAFPDLAGDDLIGPQVQDQVRQADIVLVSKTPTPSADMLECLTDITNAPVVCANATAGLSSLLLNTKVTQHPNISTGTHPAYVGWSYHGPTRVTAQAIRTSLQNRPSGLFRVKGFIYTDKFTGWEIQVVGKSIMVSPASGITETRLVGIGLAACTSVAEIDDWWHHWVARKDTSPR